MKLRRLTAVVLSGAALAFSAPASAATLQDTCIQHPEAYGQFAVTGVYSIQKRGVDRDRICRVYDSAGKLQGVMIETDYNYYRVTGPVSPPPVRSSL